MKTTLETAHELHTALTKIEQTGLKTFWGVLAKQLGYKNLTELAAKHNIDRRKFYSKNNLKTLLDATLSVPRGND